MILNPDEVKELYRRTARFYDRALLAYRLTGSYRHRRRTVELLGLKSGDVVLDLGCGTGINFPLLQERIGPMGRIIGVDLTDAMLDKARKRVEMAGWQNVELVEADLTTHNFPQDMNAAIATFSLEMVPDYDAVIRRIAGALPAGGRLAIYGLKHSERWPRWLLRLGVRLNKSFGTSSDYTSFRPFESVRGHLNEVEFQEFYFGAAYLSVGVA